MGVVAVILPLAIFVPALLRPVFKLMDEACTLPLVGLNTQVILTVVFVF